MVSTELTRIREKLRRLKEMDTDLSYFGSEEHRYELNPPAARSVVTAFEARYGVTLPDQYREFLLSVGDGGAGPYYGLYPLEYAYEEKSYNKPGAILKPFPLEQPWHPEHKPDEEFEPPAGVREGRLILSHQGCLYWSFLVVTGPQRGKVWDDFTSGGGSIEPTGNDFLEWYECWLDQGLRREMWI